MDANQCSTKSYYKNIFQNHLVPEAHTRKSETCLRNHTFRVSYARDYFVCSQYFNKEQSYLLKRLKDFKFQIPHVQLLRELHCPLV